MGRERALGLDPSTDLTQIQAALAETRQGRTALGTAGSSASRGTSEVSGITFSPSRTP